MVTDTATAGVAARSVPRCGKCLRRIAMTPPTASTVRLESSAAGIRAVKISLLALGATSVAQLVIVLVSGSVALLADTIHNFSDALTAIPLWIAFALGTKAATRRYTYGFGRAEDIAGLFVDRDDHPVGHHRRGRIDPSS